MHAFEARTLTTRINGAYHRCIDEIKEAATKGRNDVTVSLEPEEIIGVMDDLGDLGYRVVVAAGFIVIGW
jgi:hypothetical protein